MPDSSMSSEELYEYSKLHKGFVANQNKLNIGIFDKDEFDAEYYAQNNPDVTAALGTDEDVLYRHFIEYGKAEGRLGCVNKYAEHGQVVSEIADTSRTIFVYEDGFMVMRSYYLYDVADDKYLIPRTDFSDGLLDNDHNGIDDRDPFNTCEYTDLDYNCVADGAPLFPDLAGVVGYSLCKHNVIDGLFHMNCPGCESYREELRKTRVV